MTRNTCKLILVLLVCAAPLVAAVVGAEPNAGPYGELYAAAAVDQGTRQPASPDNGNRSEAAGAPAPRFGEKSTEPAGAVGLGVEEGPSGAVSSLSNIQRGWIVVVAGVGLLLSLAAAGYLAWLRAPQSEAPVSVLLPRGLPQAANSSPARPVSDEQAMPERRAA